MSDASEGRTNPQARDLFLRCAAGEPAAWEEFDAGFRPLLAALVREHLSRGGRGAAEGDVDDGVADAIAALLADGGRKLREYDPRFRPSTWLSLVARTAVGNRLRGETSRRRGISSPDALASAVCGREAPPDAASREEEARQVREAVTRLPVREQVALRQVHEHGLTHGQVGGILGLSEDAVAQMLSRARARLRGMLGDPAQKH